MNDQNLKLSLKEAKTIYVRSFYATSRNLLTFCENNRVLFLEDQMIETYCHFMSALLNDHFSGEEAKNLLHGIELNIPKIAEKGYQLAMLLKKAEAEYRKNNLIPLSPNAKGKKIKNFQKMGTNLAPYVRQEILNKMALNIFFSETDFFLAEHILMTHWDMLETIESVIVNTFGKGKDSAGRFQGDSLSWFLSQQLPASFIEASQKTGGSRTLFLALYQEELGNWLGWLIGFYAGISKKSISHALNEKLGLLKAMVKGRLTPSDTLETAL